MSTLDIQAVKFATEETGLNLNKVGQVLTMMVEEECTVPFIARYRKERTGGMDEVEIRSVFDAYQGYIEREKRRASILDTIKKMEQLTPELEKKILAATTLNQLEDIYAPYKSKRKSKGTIAKEAGLEPLAKMLMEGDKSLAEIEAAHGKEFINPDHKIKTFEDALKGAKDIIIETFAHDTELKEKLRKDYWESAKLVSSKKKDAEAVTDHHKFKDYFEYEEAVKDLKNPQAGHRFLAMRRGMTLKVLKVEVSYEEDAACAAVRSHFFDNPGSLGAREVVEDCISKSYRVYIHPSLDLEIKSELKKLADESAISVFGVNLKNLLLQPYLGAKAVLGIDPGVRTGCKVVVVDANGNYLEDFVIYPHEPRNDIQGSSAILAALIEKHGIKHIAIGDGTYGRETLAFVGKYVPQVAEGVAKATLISESGASIYSASDIARKEFPDKDVTVRGAVSIARRFQDPLAELVKIDAKSIGVGQYQHDVNQSRLKQSLNGVVENCVNFVGVDINTASAPLLSFISGVGPTVATNIVKEREKKKGFKNRKELMDVSRLSAKVFEQAAGFMRIYNGENPLDATFIHPESYTVIEEWAKGKGIELTDLVADSKNVDDLAKDGTLKEKLGEFTFNDIVKSLKAPRQDPRTEFKSTDFRKDLTSINDLKIGEWYPGIVTNITNFGAFVDIGIKENGLLHVSEMADHFVSNPLDEFKVGEQVKVRVQEVDMARKRIALSAKTGGGAGAHQGGFVSEAANRGGKKGGKGRDKPQPEFKNNAFAALKNLRLK